MALSLDKLFVFVTTDKCDAFRLAYIEPAEGTARKTDYDTKIVFLEDTQELFTHGKIYGINNVDALNTLAQYVGEIPDGYTSTTIVGFVQEVFGKISSISNSEIDKLFT